MPLLKGDEGKRDARRPFFSTSSYRRSYGGTELRYVEIRLTMRSETTDRPQLGIGVRFRLPGDCAVPVVPRRESCGITVTTSVLISA